MLVKWCRAISCRVCRSAAAGSIDSMASTYSLQQHSTIMVQTLCDMLSGTEWYSADLGDMIYGLQ